MGTLLNVGAFFSGRVQNGFETQNGFTRSGFRGIPSLVPKFAFLVVEIGLRKPPNLRIFFYYFIILFLCKQLQPFYGCKRLLGGILRPIPKFFSSKFSLFDHFWPLFWSKIDPKLTFSLNLGAFFSGRVQNGFETQNGFTRSTFRGMPCS